MRQTEPFPALDGPNRSSSTTDDTATDLPTIDDSNPISELRSNVSIESSGFNMDAANLLCTRIDVCSKKKNHSLLLILLLLQLGWLKMK